MGGICMECGRRRIGGIWSLVFFFFCDGKPGSTPLGWFFLDVFPLVNRCIRRCAMRYTELVEVMSKANLSRRDACFFLVVYTGSSRVRTFSRNVYGH